VRVKLKDIADFVNGRAFKSSEWSDQGLPIIRIQNLNDPEKPFNYFEGEYDQKNFVQSGNILLSWSGTPGTSFGCFKWTREDGLLNQHIFKVQLVREKVDQDYFVYAVNKNLNILIDQSHGGVGLKHITKGKLNEVSIYLPPLDQQKKITSILDAADAYRQKTKALIEKYDELTQSLFLDMFGDPVSNPREWEFKKFQDFTNKYNQGVNTTTEEIKYSDEGTFPIIRAGEVGKGSLKFDSVVWVDKENEYKIKNSCKPIKGDVLYANIGANLGTACLVETSRSFGIAWNVFRIQLKEKINRKFFVYQLNCEWIKRIVWSKVKTATVPFISGKQISSIDFINPPIELQNQFAERVQAIEAQKAQAEASLAQAEDLFNSLLQRAFKGELTS
jgi:type I restriction enzyme, S subunit